MIEVARLVCAPPEDVWAVLADGWVYSGWVVGASRMRAVDTHWPAPGATLHHSIGGWPMLLDDTTTVLEASPGRELVLRARGWPVGAAEVRVQLSAHGVGTMVRMAEDVTSGIGVLVPEVTSAAALGRDRPAQHRESAPVGAAGGGTIQVRSLWLDRADRISYPPMEPGGRYDIVVVGAGLTGLVTALLFARAGRSVAVLEGRYVGAGTTGNTTAKVSLLQGTRLSELAAKHAHEVVGGYVEANREGAEWLLRYCAEQSLAVTRRPAITYATTASGRRSVRAELDACERAELDVRWVKDVGLPFATRGAVRLDDQAQLDPMDVLLALAADLVERGGVIFERTRVQQVHSDAGMTVVTEHGAVRAGHVVLATGTPVLDRAGYFARLEPLRSYCLAFTVPGAVPTGMCLSADAVTRSLRTARTDRGEQLLVGGNGHVVGRGGSTRALVEDLRRWTEDHFPGAELTHSWSAQDYRSIDGLPYVGPLTPRNEQVLIATGYDKWGMTNAVAAGLALVRRVLGEANTPWAAALQSWRVRELSGLPTFATLNAKVAWNLGQGWVAPWVQRGQPPVPAEGEGWVESHLPQPVATCTVDGVTHRVSAVCPHLMGVVRWNDAERSWDCPLHGSRFDADGAVLEGPATHGLSAQSPAVVPAEGRT